MVAWLRLRREAYQVPSRRVDACGPTKVFSLQRAKLESLLDQQPLIVYRVMRGIARFAHQVLHRSGAQMTELTAYIFKSKANY
jgi:hypothetical protein